MYDLNNPLREVEQQRKNEMVAKVTENKSNVPVSLSVDNHISQELFVTSPTLTSKIAATQVTAENSGPSKDFEQEYNLAYRSTDKG